MGLEEISLDDLKRIKLNWYMEACASGVISNVAQVCREFGSRVDTQKWRWADPSGTVHVYVDDYGRYMTVHVGGSSRHQGGRCVGSTHETERLWVPGEWLAIVEPYFKPALQEGQERQDQAAHRAKLALARELGLAD